MARKSTKAGKGVRSVRTPETKRAWVCLRGDWAIVEEYIHICSDHGYAVTFDSNDAPRSLPAYDTRLVRKSTQIPRDAAFALELTNIDLVRKRRNIEMLDSALPASTAIVSSSITISATEQSSWIKHKNRLVGCSALPTLGQKPLVEIAPTVFSPKETVQVVQRFFESLGKEIELVQDRIGMVFPRIICQIMNEAAFAIQDEIAAPRDIDDALKVGASYPFGPIEWADRIGLPQVVAVLTALHADLAEDRYRLAPLLRQMAVGGTWWNRTQVSFEERQGE